MALISLQAFTVIASGRHAHISTCPTQLRRFNCQQQPTIEPLGLHGHRPPAFTRRCIRLVSRRTGSVKAHASSAAAAQPLTPDEAPQADSGPVAKFKALLSPFSEPSTNKKLLALCGAQALSSVATLIHDTYLPLYLSEELKLSNSKASHLGLVLGFSARSSLLLLCTEIVTGHCKSNVQEVMPMTKAQSRHTLYCRLATCKPWRSSYQMPPSPSAEPWQMFYRQHG